MDLRRGCEEVKRSEAQDGGGLDLGVGFDQGWGSGEMGAGRHC